MELKKELVKIAKEAKQAAGILAVLPVKAKNKILAQMAGALWAKRKAILGANQLDLKRAYRDKLAQAFIDRLALNEKRIKGMADSLLAVAKLPDPVGAVIKSWQVVSGLRIKKVRVSIGVILIIYESRPNVTADCIGLCFKSGNSVILRGGSQALNSNRAIYNVLRAVLRKNNLPPGVINLVTNQDRAAIDLLLRLNDYIDLVMPRGGEGLIKRVAAVSRIPVIKHYKGICHVYVDASANLEMAQEICFNAKVQRPGVCNAMESLLVHRNIAGKFLPAMLGRFKAAGVEIRGDRISRKIVKGIKSATEKDYRTEYLDLILSLKVVKNLDEAIKHINNYGSHHSDAIVTKEPKHAQRFLKEVDSACVYLNASTRFTDGYQFGLGAEIGISTDKLHARGPVALEELTTYKYTVLGNGQIRR